MKHIATILSLFLLLFATSCENANVKKLKKEVAKTNAQCPVNYGIGGDLLSVKYDEQENSIMMYVSINNEIGGAFFPEKEQRSNAKPTQIGTSECSRPNFYQRFSKCRGESKLYL